MMKKDISSIIKFKFDDKEYSKEETAELYQGFFNFFAEVIGIKLPKTFGMALVEKLEEEKRLKETRTSETQTEKEI